MDPIVAGSIISAGASTINGISGQVFAEKNREKNYDWNEKAAEQADKRQRRQYHDLYSPSAMMKQYAAAGLSPSLMMSGGQSAVGQSSAQGNQSQGINGTYPAGIQIDPLMAAQIANIQADTEGKKIDNENKGNIAEATIAHLMSQVTLNGSLKNNADAEANLKKAQEALTSAQTTATEAKTPHEVRRAAAEAATAEWRTAQTIYEAINAGYEMQFNIDSYQTRLQQLSKNLSKTIQEIAVLKEDEALKAQMANYYYELPAIQKSDVKTKEDYNQAYDKYVDNAKDVALRQVEAMLAGVDANKTKAILDLVGKLVGAAASIGFGFILKAPNSSAMLFTPPVLESNVIPT